MRANILAVIAASSLAASAGAADEPRFTVLVNGLFAPSSATYDSVRTFNAFAEEGSVETSYDPGSGPGFEAGIVWNFARSFGVGLAGGVVSRSTDATYTAHVPHPLYLNRPRTAEGTLSSLDYQEQQGHLDLVYTGRSGSFDFSVFAGPSYFNVSSDLLSAPDYDQSYPYDTITVTNVPALSFDDTGFGFNAGAGAGYRFSRNFGVGITGRFSRATIELVPEVGKDTVEIDAGGFQIAGGLRIYF